MATTSTCPQVSDLHDLAAGRLSPEVIDALVQHLESCDACLARVQTLSPTDTLADVLAKAATLTPGADEPVVTRLIERLTKLGQTQAPAGAVPKMLMLTCACGKSLKVKRELAGKKVKCPSCGKTMPVPEATQPEPSRQTTPAPAMTDARTLLPSGEQAAPAVNVAEQKTVLPSAGDTDAGVKAAEPMKKDATQGLAAADVNAELYDFLAPAQQPDELGRLGPYRILKVLGAGGMGVVFRAEDPQLERLVALKAMLPALAASPSAKKRFLREAKAAAAIKHDHIVAIYQVSEDRGAPFLAMEFLDGEPLDKYLHRETKPPLADILRIGREIADGLAAAHAKGLIHRDIKPGNIWLEDRNPTSRAREEATATSSLPDGRGSVGRVKILDFGLARAASEESGLTQQGAIIGTPAYMAPEQARGTTVDARCDLFSLGVVLYRMCTGKQPFQGTDTVATLMAVSTHEPPPPVELNASLPTALSDLVMKLLEKDVAKRVGSATEVVQALAKLEKQLEAGQITEAKSPGRKKKDASKWDKAAPDTISLDAAQSAKTSPRESKRGLGSVIGLAVAAALLLVLLGGGVLVYQLMFRTANGTLIVEIEGKDADVRFKDGKLLIYDSTGEKLLYTLTPSEKNKTLPVGEYRIKVEGADGAKVDTDRFEMTRKGWTVRVTLAPPEIAQKGPDPDSLPRFTHGLSFDGDGTVNIPSLKLDRNAPFTVEAWVTPSSHKFANFSMVVRFLGQSALRVGGKGERWSFMVTNEHGNEQISGSQVRAKQTVHLAGVRTEHEIRLYADGKLTARKKIKPGALPEPQEDANIGGPGKIGFHGIIHGVRISSVARYDDDFTPAKRFDADKKTLAVYRFEEGKGTVLSDASGNGHDGRILNAKWLIAEARSGPTGDRFKNSIGMEFALVPKGRSWLGGSNGKEGPNEVTIAQEFYLGVYEVTQEEWQKVMGKNPSEFKGERLPVEMVSWDDAQEFIKLVNKKVKTDAREAGWEYRLPTVQQWEYACRGGPMTDKAESAFDFYFERPSTTLSKDQANIADSGLQRTRSVGSYPPNRLGLHDMHGNVWEWCDDESPDAKNRVRRGGGWDSPPPDCRAALPYANPPSHTDLSLGMRVALVPVATAELKPPVIAELGVHDFAEIHDADEKRFDAWIAQMKKAGFRPTRMTVQTVKNGPRYTAVALKDDKDWPWEFTREDQSVEGIEDKQWKRKFEAVAHALFRDKGKLREAIVWAKDDSLDNEGIWVGDAGFTEDKIKKATKKAKVRLLSRCAVFVGNAPEFGIILEGPDGVPWQESYNLVFDDLKAYVEKYKTDGWRPDHFNYCGVGAKRLFGAILIKNSNKTDWDVSWALAPTEYAKELTARKALGFRPLTAIGHEDNTATQRFSVIWVRYRDPNAKVMAEVRAPDLTNIKPIFVDTFNNPKSGFTNNLKDDLGEAGYVDGKYVIKQNPKSYRSRNNGTKYSNFACEVTGRTLKQGTGQWGLEIFAPGIKHGLTVTITYRGQLLIKPSVADGAKDRGPKIGPQSHPAIKKGNELNTLLVIVRGRDVEVYVNSIAVCPAFTMDRDITPAFASLVAFAGKEGSHSEFTRYTVWSSEGLPRASSLGSPIQEK